VTDGEAALVQQRHRCAQELERIGTSVALVIVGEVLPDVAHASRPEERVDHRMRQDVSVGMAFQSARMWDLDAP
jgi:hypothetical protein